GRAGCAYTETHRLAYLLCRDPQPHKMRISAMQAMGHAMTADQHRANDRAGGMSRKLAILADLASLGLAGFAVALMITPGNPIQIRFGSSSTTTTPAASQTAAPQLAWVAAAPGRVEPRS